MRKTTNYGLALYDKEDKMNITSEENSLNHNMELIDSALKGKANDSDIPTKLSELENDKNYLSSIPAEYVTDSKLLEKSFATETYVNDKIAEAQLGSGNGSGLTNAQINALNEMFKITSYTENPVTAYENFKNSFGISDDGEIEVTLTSISATYNGGNVEVGTSLSSLTGITVKAHYSDGTSNNVTDYTLSGEIVEGSNIITVNYQGLITSFTVIGVSNTEENIVLNSISATYTGGEVTAGTPLTSLTGITVTGTYSDGNTYEITGYELSGEIKEGENTITVTYNGKTTTLTVTGIVESGGEETELDILSTDLLAYYDMRTALTDDNYITDLSGNGNDKRFYPNNGYYENGTIYRGDKTQNWNQATEALALVSSNSYSYGDKLTFFVTVSDVDSNEKTPLLSIGNATTGTQIITFMGGVIVYGSSFNNQSSSTKYPTDKKPFVIAATIETDGNECIYLNGELKSTIAAKPIVKTGALNLLLGYGGENASQDTKIHNVAVYNNVLSAEQIATISNTLLTNAGGVE